MTLNSHDVTSVTTASYQQVISSLRVAGALGALSAANPFSSGLIQKKQNYSAQEVDAAKELVSIGGPNHCIDGWSFLSRGLAAVLAGDLHSARHFAYYAELRATLSLLSSGGVGIFDHNHFVISPNGSLRKLQSERGTHSIAWDALHVWSTSPGAAYLFSASMPAGSQTAGDILQKLYPNATSSPRIVAGEMLTDWGIDLIMTNADRASRNISSYRPQVFNPLRSTPLANVEFITSFWTAFEPYAANRFDLIDRHIMRLAIEKQMSVLGLNRLDQATYDRLDEPEKNWLSLEFINRQISPDDHPLLVMARMTAINSSPFSMISRAALLLRVASAVTRHNLDQAGKLTASDIDAWLGEFCLSRALVESVPLPPEATDLWYDVEEAIDRLSEIVTERTGPGLSMRGWHLSSDRSSALPRASEAERIGVLSLSAP